MLEKSGTEFGVRSKYFTTLPTQNYFEFLMSASSLKVYCPHVRPGPAQNAPLRGGISKEF